MNEEFLGEAVAERPPLLITPRAKKSAAPGLVPHAFTLRKWKAVN